MAKTKSRGPKPKILLVAGARPNYMKIAPLVRELQRDGRGLDWRLVDTGQHYDYELSRVFFEEFDIPRPDHFLGVGSGSHARQTARIMVAFEKVCRAEGPDLVLVVGDVNSTMACSLTAAKMGIGVAHVEAGLRSFDRSMPEEINRIVTDALSDFLFVSEGSGLRNLRREGCAPGKVFFVGNVMIDTLFYSLAKLDSTHQNVGEPAARPYNRPASKQPRIHASTISSSSLQRLDNSPYAVLTLHRPANVDEKAKLADILDAVAEIGGRMPVHFPVHPRTRRSIEKYGLLSWLEDRGIRLLPPLSYLDFLSLWRHAGLVLTDSGGIQEETTVLGIPCFTIRDNTERPITVTVGTNRLVGSGGEGIRRAFRDFCAGRVKKGRVPRLWDGNASRRILDILGERLTAAKKRVIMG